MVDVRAAFERLDARLAAIDAIYEARLAEIKAHYEARMAEISAQRVEADPLLPEDDSLPDLNRSGPIDMPKQVMEAVDAVSEMTDADLSPEVKSIEADPSEMKSSSGEGSHIEQGIGTPLPPAVQKLKLVLMSEKANYGKERPPAKPPEELRKDDPQLIRADLFLVEGEVQDTDELNKNLEFVLTESVDQPKSKTGDKLEKYVLGLLAHQLNKLKKLESQFALHEIERRSCVQDMTPDPNANKLDVMDGVLGVLWPVVEDNKQMAAGLINDSDGDLHLLEEIKTISYLGKYYEFKCTSGTSYACGVGAASSIRYILAYSTRLKFEFSIWTCILLPPMSVDSMGAIDPVGMESLVRADLISESLAGISNLSGSGRLEAIVFNYKKSVGLISICSFDNDQLIFRRHVLGFLAMVWDITEEVYFRHFVCDLLLSHCDIKPSNVILDCDLRAQLADLSLASTGYCQAVDLADSKIADQFVASRVENIEGCKGLDGSLLPDNLGEVADLDMSFVVPVHEALSDWEICTGLIHFFGLYLNYVSQLSLIRNIMEDRYNEVLLIHVKWHEQLDIKNKLEIKLLIEVVNEAKNGVLDYGEFVAFTVNMQRVENGELIHRAFMFFDKDKSGYIELEELGDASAYESGVLYLDFQNGIMQEVDKDKEGRINHDEFVVMVKTGSYWRKVSWQYSRERVKSLSGNIMKDEELRRDGRIIGQPIVVAPPLSVIFVPYDAAEFITIAQHQSAAFTKARKLSSVLSATSSACDHIHDWVHRSPEETNLVVKLTYSYGVDSRTDFGHFVIATIDVYKLEELVMALEFVTKEPSLVKRGTAIIAFVKDPDGYLFELMQAMLHVGDLDRANKFFKKALGMKFLRRIRIPQDQYDPAMMGYSDEQDNCEELIPEYLSVVKDFGYNITTSAMMYERSVTAAMAEFNEGKVGSDLAIEFRGAEFDASRGLQDGSLMQIAKVSPLDAVFDDPDDVLEDIKTNKIYVRSSKWSGLEVAKSIEEDLGSHDILVHSLADGLKVSNLAAISASSYSSYMRNTIMDEKVTLVGYSNASKEWLMFVWFSRPRPPDLKKLSDENQVRRYLNLEDKVLGKGGAMLRNGIVGNSRELFVVYLNLSSIKLVVIVENS